MSFSEHDVVVAGAGPAGAHTALRLARAGWRVALLDRRTFPRPKPCGEFLSPACLPLLEDLGLLEPLRRAGAASVSGMDIETLRHRARGHYRPLGPFFASHGGGAGIRREVLDHQAVLAAGADPRIEVLLGWSVSAPLVDDTGRVVGVTARSPDGESVELRARYVVGADGVHSRVARGLGLRKATAGRPRFALVARFEGVADRELAALHVTGRDYFAACPIDAGLFTANLVVDGDELPTGAAGLEGFFYERLERAPGLARRLSGAELAEPIAACGPLRAETRRCVGPGFVLVGDACGFVDPLTGEGIYCAMQAAQWAAGALDEALRAPAGERAALDRYARARRRELGPRYALARLLQRGLRRRAIPELVVGTLERVPAMWHLLLGLTGDYVPPRGLLLPSVWRSARPRSWAPVG